jgi:hypothetical protein
MPILQGGGAGSHTLPNHVIGKWTVNTALTMGHQSRPGALQKFFSNTYGSQYTKCTLNNIIILIGEDDIARFDSRQYTQKVDDIG